MNVTIPSETYSALLQANGPLRSLLLNAKEKLMLYRAASSGEYVGGIEHTVLIREIDKALGYIFEGGTGAQWPYRPAASWDAAFGLDYVRQRDAERQALVNKAVKYALGAHCGPPIETFVDEEKGEVIGSVVSPLFAHVVRAEFRRLQSKQEGSQ